jgi:hypothetical protein
MTKNKNIARFQFVEVRYFSFVNLDKVRQVTRAKSKNGAVVKHQRVFVVLKSTSIAKQLFKSGAAPLYRSLVTSLKVNNLAPLENFPQLED